MTDLSQTITPKSDQLNADDLIAGPRTIKVTKATVNQGAEQPASIFFEGDNGKPYKPGLSMRRVLVRAWGVNASAYVGRRMTLYRDDNVKFGGVAVGGIRISHMSDIGGRSRSRSPRTGRRASLSRSGPCRPSGPGRRQAERRGHPNQAPPHRPREGRPRWRRSR